MRTLSLLGLDAAERPRLNAASLRRLARLGTVVRWPRAALCGHPVAGGEADFAHRAGGWFSSGSPAITPGG